MNFSAYATDRITKIETTLKSILQKENPKLKRINNCYKQYAESMFGGKFLRGLLVCIGYETTGKKFNEHILQVASMFEIVHSSLLIHDDIIDQSTLRRNRPSLHMVLGGNHVGKSLALCLGDLGLVLSAQIINNTRFKTKYKYKVHNFFSECIKQTIYGQLLDISLSNVPKKDAKDVIEIHKLKTSAYSFVAPLGVGMLIGGCSTQKLEAARLFGTNLGIAFQIYDDILGVFGDEKKTGKSVTSDITEGKNTLLISYASKHATLLQQRVLTKYYGQPTISGKDCELVKEIFIDTGALAYSEHMAEKYLASAQKLITSLTHDAQSQILLQQVAKAVINRTK